MKGSHIGRRLAPLPVFLLFASMAFYACGGGGTTSSPTINPPPGPGAGDTVVAVGVLTEITPVADNTAIDNTATDNTATDNTATDNASRRLSRLVVAGRTFFTDNSTQKVLLDNGGETAAGPDNQVLLRGMVLRVFATDNVATRIEYASRMSGPIEEVGQDNASAGTSTGAIRVLGHTVLLDDNTWIYDSPDDTTGDDFNGNAGATFNTNMDAEISGFADNADRIHATFIRLRPRGTGTDNGWRIKGYLSRATAGDNTGAGSDNTFLLRLSKPPAGDNAASDNVLLQDNTVRTVRLDNGASLPGGFADGQFVEVTVSRQVGSEDALHAARIEAPSRGEVVSEIVDDNDVTLEGFPIFARTAGRTDNTGTDNTGTDNTATDNTATDNTSTVTFTLEGVTVVADNATRFGAFGDNTGGLGGLAAQGQRIRVAGTFSGGVLRARSITSATQAGGFPDGPLQAFLAGRWFR